MSIIMSIKNNATHYWYLILFYTSVCMNVTAAGLSDVIFEDVTQRADFIGIINVKSVLHNEEGGCGLTVIAVDEFSENEMLIHVVDDDDVKGIGRFFSVLRKANLNQFSMEYDCLGKHEHAYIASAGYQSIFQFGDGVSLSEGSLMFHRASIFHHSRHLPRRDFLRGFVTLQSRIVGEIDFESVSEHLCTYVYPVNPISSLGVLCRDKGLSD